MKKITTTFMAMLFSGMAGMAQNGACIEMKMTASMGATGDIKTYFSPAGHRSEMQMSIPQMPNAQKVISITKKSNPDVVISLNETNKTYSENPPHKNDNSKEKYTIENLGDQKMMGYSCKHVLVTSSDGHKTEMWITKDIADYEQYKSAYNTQRASVGGMESSLKEAGVEGFPVKYVMKGKDGEITMELVKMEKTNVADTMFEIPPGYTKAGGPGNMAGQPNPANMTPEERAKYIEEMKAKYGK